MQILRFDEEGLSGSFARLDEADGGRSVDSGEEIVSVREIERLAAVEFEHEVRILRGSQVRAYPPSDAQYQLTSGC